MNDSHTYLTTAEVAERFRVTPQALHNQRLRGQKPGALGVSVGRHLLFDIVELESWFAERQVTRP